MPITNVEDSKQLEFGQGDIVVAPALLKSEDTVGVVCFFQDTQSNPIGDSHSDYPPGMEAEVANTPVRMLFEKEESIDVVIWALQEAKRMMQEKKGAK